MSDSGLWTSGAGSGGGVGGAAGGGSANGGAGGSGRPCATRGSVLSKTTTMPSQASAIVTIAKAVKQMEVDTHSTHQQMERTQQAVRTVARRSRTQKKLVQMMGKRMKALEERLKLCMEGEAELFRKLNESRNTASPRRPRSSTCCPPSKVVPPRPVSRSADPSMLRNRPPNAPRIKPKALTSRPQSTSPVRHPVPKTKTTSINTSVQPSKSSSTRPIVNTRLRSNSVHLNSNVRDHPPPTQSPPSLTQPSPHPLRPFTFSRSVRQPAPIKSVVRSSTCLNQRSNVPFPNAERKIVPNTVSPAPDKRESRIPRPVSCTNANAPDIRTPHPIFKLPKTVRRSVSCVDSQQVDEGPTSPSASPSPGHPAQTIQPPIFSNLRPPRRLPRSSSVPVRPPGLQIPLPAIDISCQHTRCSYPFPSILPRFPVRSPTISPSSAVRLSFLSSPSRQVVLHRVTFKPNPPQFTSSPTNETELFQPALQADPPQVDLPQNNTRPLCSGPDSPNNNNPQESNLSSSNATKVSPNNELAVMGSSSRTTCVQSNSPAPTSQFNLLRSRSRSLTNSPSPGTCARSSSLPPRPMCCYPRTNKPPRQRPCCKKCLSGLGRYLLKLSHEGRVEETRTVLDTGVNVNFSNSLKWTPLHKAAAGTHDSIITLLLDHGADVHAKTTYGLTPLHLAAYNDGSGRCVALLIDAGSDIDSRSRSGRTPLDYAEQCGNKAAVQALESAGASRTVNANHHALHFDPVR